MRGKGVHSAYEEDMLRRNAVEMLDALKKAVKKAGPSIEVPADGHAAAVQVVQTLRTIATVLK